MKRVCSQIILACSRRDRLVCTASPARRPRGLLLARPRPFIRSPNQERTAIPVAIADPPPEARIVCRGARRNERRHEAATARICLSGAFWTGTQLARSAGPTSTGGRASGCAGVESAATVHARPSGSRRGDPPRRRRLLPLAPPVRAGIQRSAPEPGVDHGHYRNDSLARNSAGTRSAR